MGGSTFNSYVRENSVPNKVKFQETEWQDALELNLYDFDSRFYDPFTWRTPTQDAHADLYPEISPYSFLANNPVNMLDPTGMDAMELNGGGGGMALCPTCPQNDPKFKPYIDDPKNTYHYDPATGNVSLLLNEVTVTADKPKEANVAVPIYALPEFAPLVTVGAGAGTAAALTVGLVFMPSSGLGAGEAEMLAKINAEQNADLIKKMRLNARNPAQDKPLSKGEIEKLKRNGWDHSDKGRRGGGKTDLYKDRDGNIYQKPKGGTGEGEPIGRNIKDLK